MFDSFFGISFVVGGVITGVVLGYLFARLRHSDEIPIDGLKQAMRNLREAVGRLERAINMQPIDPHNYTTGAGLMANHHNVKELQRLAENLTARTLQAVNRVSNQESTSQIMTSVAASRVEQVPRRIEVPDTMQSIPRDDRANISNDPWFQDYPQSEVRVIEPVAEVIQDPSQAPLIDLYNLAVNDRNRRGEFQERFHPLRIGTVNASDRRRDPNLPAEYREASDGNFLAVEDSRRIGYLIVPRFDLTIKEANFAAGAIGTVFECRGWNPLLSFSSVMLRRPATFEKTGDAWTLRTPGLLELGQGE